MAGRGAFVARDADSILIAEICREDRGEERPNVRAYIYP